MSAFPDFVEVDPEIQCGISVFKEIRVPVIALFWHLQQGTTVADYLKNFPIVTKSQTDGALMRTSKKFEERNTSHNPNLNFI